jgi:hypothetical protein
VTGRRLTARAVSRPKRASCFLKYSPHPSQLPNTRFKPTSLIYCTANNSMCKTGFHQIGCTFIAFRKVLPVRYTYL